MKFFCEYCGCRIDPEKDIKCPNCGASYKKNATFLKNEEEIKKQKENALKTFEQTRKTIKTNSKVFSIIFISIFAIVFLTIIGSMVGFFVLGKKASKTIPGIIESQLGNDEKAVKEQEKVTVGINEYGKTKDYQVKVTGYEKLEDIFKELSSDYEYVTFHLTVENLKNSSISSQNVNCIVDGVAQTNYYYSGYSTLPFTINTELTVTGDATFKVPADAKSYDIRYGDYVTIHIEKE